MAERQIINIFIFQIVQADIFGLVLAIIAPDLSMQCHDIVIIMIQNKGIVDNRTVLRGKFHTGNYNISITVRFPRILKKQQILWNFFNAIEKIVTVADTLLVSNKSPAIKITRTSFFDAYSTILVNVRKISLLRSLA